MKHLLSLQLLPYLLALVPCTSISVLADECIYLTENSEVHSVARKEDIPAKYLARSKCRTPGDQQRMAAPDEINLGGTIRREDLNSPLGTISLRWPRSAETLFGRTPVKAMADAARTVSKVIRSSSFPASYQNMNVPWNIVFMDADVPSDQVPLNLMTNCHPGWMTPPSNIYIVAQRVAEGCGSNSGVSASVADKKLTEVLVHEMAHAFEAYVLQKQFGFERMRAEGFATWFTIHAAGGSSILSQGQLEEQALHYGIRSLQNSPSVSSFRFSGSAEDYFRASLHFMAVEKRFGLRGIATLYQTMRKQNLHLVPAIQESFNWDEKQLLKEMLKLGSP